jgi:hypothetical protein
MAGETKARLLDWANFALFALVLLTGGVLFLTLPKQSVSQAEKRGLAPPPQWSLKAALSGDLFRSIDDYYSDHFVFRDTFLAMADTVKSLRGVGAADVQVFDTTTPSSARTVALADNNRLAPQAPPNSDLDEGDYANIRSIVVYKGRAVQIAMGSYLSAARFAGIANEYHRALGPGVKVYVMAIPVGSDFYLPHAIDHGEMRERENIQQLYSDLDPGVVGVDAYSQMSQHTAEYIEYRTDHHWTGLGAYYAYRAFATAAGFTPLPLSAMTKKTIPNFLGSLYYYTRSDTLKQNVDQVDYYVVPYATQEYVYNSLTARPMTAHVYQETAKGGNAYGVFIGGDHPLTQIVSPNSPTLRKIVIIKDSYANAFAPYLASHYREVWVVDYRYFKGNIASLMRQHGINEILFAHNTYVINGGFAVQRAQTMLDSGGTLTASEATHSGASHVRTE